jgi:hypothetical protein
MPFDMPFGIPFEGILFAMLGLRWLLYATPLEVVDVGVEEDDAGCEVCDCDGDGDGGF